MWNDPKRGAWEVEQCPDCGGDVVIKRRPHGGRCPTCARAALRAAKAARAAERARRAAAKPVPLPDRVVRYVDGAGNRCEATFDTDAQAESYLAAMKVRDPAVRGIVDRYCGGPRHRE